jgi:Winged helix-turn helix
MEARHGDSSSVARGLQGFASARSCAEDERWPAGSAALGFAAIYDGATRTEAGKIGGVGLQIIRDWVMRFNAGGAAGLLDGKSPGTLEAQ